MTLGNCIHWLNFAWCLKMLHLIIHLYLFFLLQIIVTIPLCLINSPPILTSILPHWAYNPHVCKQVFLTIPFGRSAPNNSCLVYSQALCSRRAHPRVQRLYRRLTRVAITSLPGLHRTDKRFLEFTSQCRRLLGGTR